ncbi:uncharacterized protein METZ01_LOCUS296262, partial [marine metagenome]
DKRSSAISCKYYSREDNTGTSWCII